jgi:hypothetical protein
MTLYPSPIGHVEIRIDRRDPRPPRIAFGSLPLRTPKRPR